VNRRLASHGLDRAEERRRAHPERSQKTGSHRVSPSRENPPCDAEYDTILPRPREAILTAPICSKILHRSGVEVAVSKCDEASRPARPRGKQVRIEKGDSYPGLQGR
jgi:hypothetical protein